MRYLLSLDQGTTSSRSILFDAKGGMVASAQQEITQYFPHEGWVEHDPQELWQSQYHTIRQVMAEVGARADDILAIGICNQRETTLLWEKKTGDPLHRAIVWQDRRTAPQIAQWRAAGLEPEVQRSTGLRLDPYFSASKLAWLLDHVPGARARAERGELCFGTVDSWLLWQLTEGQHHATDVSNAARTLLFNIHTMDWDAALLAHFAIPPQLLPTVYPCAQNIAEAGIPEVAGVPIAAMAGDQQAATFGQACFAQGQGKNTYGTGCFLMMNTGNQPSHSDHRLLSTVAWQREAQAACYALEGSIFMGGAVVQWLRDGLGIIQNSSQVEALAGSVDDNGGVYLVPAFVGLGAPYWDAYARASIVGMTRGSNAAHIARAGLESIAYQVYDVVQAMQADAGSPLKELRVDGGAARNALLLQFQADILGIPIVRPTITETTALGVAYLAGLAIGHWQSLEQIAALWREDARFEPHMSTDAREALLARWHEAVRRSQHWMQDS